MPPPQNNRLAPPLQNSLAYSVPVPLEPGMLRPAPTRFVPQRELENLSIGLGRGVRSGMEGTAQTLTQPVATAQALIEAARQIGTDPRIVLDMLRAARQKAMSGSLGLGELIGENVTPTMRGRAPVKRDIFIGKTAKTWDAAAAARAEQLERAGKTPEEIWQQTGTFRSPDGQWRQEILDLPATWKGKGEFPASMQLEHPALYEAYPDLQSVWVKTKPGQKGSYGRQPGMSPEEIITVGEDNPRTIALHEMQHAVQQREGFARGGQPFSTTGASDFQKASTLLNKFYDKMTRYKELRKQLPPEQRPRLSHSINWNYREFDIDELFDDIEDTVTDPVIRKEMLDILDEIDVERQNVYGIQEGIFEQEQQLRNYMRLAGEAEARAVETRSKYTPGMLRQRLPTADYDVPIDELIFR